MNKTSAADQRRAAQGRNMDGEPARLPVKCTDAKLMDAWLKKRGATLPSPFRRKRRV